MPSSQVTRTPSIIQQAWNDGLFSLREKRNGVARGSVIEEKCMYVLGLGWKFRGAAEVKDTEIENTLYVSLQGLTQEAKFLKIGQVLWEQCDEQFILKMISSMSNATPAQTKMYEQISLKEKQNFKGYFTKAAMNAIKNNSLSGHAVLNRESRQMSSNSNLNSSYQKTIDDKKKDLESSKINSKGFSNRMVKLHTSNKEIKLLANELEIVLKTTESSNLVNIANSLGILVESGSNKKYLIEEIKAIVCAYVEGELLVGRSISSKNVYIRQTPNGLSTIKKLLRYTSFAHLTFDSNISITELKEMGADIVSMRDRLAMSKGLFKKFSSKKLDRNIDQTDAFLEKVKRRQLKGIGSKKPQLKTNAKFKKSMEIPLYNLLSKISKDMSYSSFSGPILYNYPAIDDKHAPIVSAISEWIKDNANEIEMAMSVISKEVIEQDKKLKKLQFFSLSNDELLEKLFTLANSMGIERELYPVVNKDGIRPDTPAFYMVAILRRYEAIQSEGNKFNLFALSKKKKDKKLNLIEAKIESNQKEAADEKTKNDRFIKAADGSYRPISIEPSQLKDFYLRMQPVYVVGGSVYAFGSGGAAGIAGGTPYVSESGKMTPEFTKVLDAKVARSKRFSDRLVGKQEAFVASSVLKENMGAFGTQEAPLVQIPGVDANGKPNEDNPTFIRRVIKAKMMSELVGKDLTINPGIQPVFLVNKGINTSNIETTALLNMLPSLLDAIPLFGTAAGMAVRMLLQDEINAAKNLPKFAKGGSFSTRNSNVSQFISGDSVTNRINPEKVTIDWATQRVNVQPLNNTTNNVTNLENGKVTDPIMGTPSTITVSGKSGKSSEAMSVYNAVNPFDENLSGGSVTATPMEVLVSLKESLVEILGTLTASNQTEQTHAAMTAKVVDAINSLNGNMKSESGNAKNIFGPLDRLARGE